MKRGKLLVLVGSMCLVLVLALLPFMAACAQPAPAPAPAPAPKITTVPAPVPKPAPAPAPKPEHERVMIRLLTSPMGISAYYWAFKFADEVNKSHPWLRIEVTEGLGTMSQCLEMMNNPKLGETTLWNSVTPTTQFARTATTPFKQTYNEMTGSKVLTAFAQFNMFLSLLTTDPDIKTIHDLVGKKVVLAQKGMSASYLIEKILEKNGILDKIKLQYMGYKPSADALRDGLADATVFYAFPTTEPNAYTPGASWHELFSMRRVYVVSLGDPEVMKQLVKEGVPVEPIVISDGTVLGQESFQEPVTVYFQGSHWIVDAIMDDELVYEVAKLNYETLDVVKQVHPSLKALLKEQVANVDREELFHPGAIKFYKEQGIPIGFTGL